MMQHCAEERRKLATEWSHFHAQEKQRLERVEREASRAMERDTHREGNIISLAQVCFTAGMPANHEMSGVWWAILVADVCSSNYLKGMLPDRIQGKFKGCFFTH